MKRIEVKEIKDVELENPILVEGLPGIGHVGKLVAEHMIDELGAQKIAEVYSSHFPPQVIVLADGLVRMVRSEFYAFKSEKQDQLLAIADLKVGQIEKWRQERLNDAIIISKCSCFAFGQLYAFGHAVVIRRLLFPVSCQTCSVTKGIKGCNSRKLASST